MTSSGKRTGVKFGSGVVLNGVTVTVGVGTDVTTGHVPPVMVTVCDGAISG